MNMSTHRFSMGGHYSNPYSSLYIGNLYFSDLSTLNIDNIDVIHSFDTLPTKQEFIKNYTNTFKVEYNPETNQLVENNKYYEYELNDFSDDSITINNEYITNNYVVVEGNTIIEGDSNDYTPLLQRIFISIIELPDKMYAKFEGLFSKDEEEEPEEPVEEEEPVEGEEPEEKEGEYTKVLDDILDFMKELPKKNW